MGPATKATLAVLAWIIGIGSFLLLSVKYSVILIVTIGLLIVFILLLLWCSYWAT
jgi:hypothetical protein